MTWDIEPINSSMSIRKLIVHHGMHLMKKRLIGMEKNTHGLLIMRCGAREKLTTSCQTGSTESEFPIAELIQVFQNGRQIGNHKFRTFLETQAFQPKNGSKEALLRTGIRYL